MAHSKSVTDTLNHTRHTREMVGMGILLTGLLVVTNVGWSIAYRRQCRDQTSPG
jgi:hypothetical protein